MTANEEKDAFSALINLYRRRSGLKKLKRVPSLDAIALQRANGIDNPYAIGGGNIAGNNEAMGVCRSYDSITFAVFSLFTKHGENSEALAGNWSHFGLARVEVLNWVLWVVVFENVSSMEGEYMPSGTEYYSGVGVNYIEDFTREKMGGGYIYFYWESTQRMRFPDEEEEARNKFREYSKLITIVDSWAGTEYDVELQWSYNYHIGGGFRFRIPVKGFFYIYNLPGSDLANDEDSGAISGRPLYYYFNRYYNNTLPEYCARVSADSEEFAITKNAPGLNVVQIIVKYQGAFFRFRDALTDGRPKGNISCTFSCGDNDLNPLRFTTNDSSWVQASDRRGFTKTNVGSIEKFADGVEDPPRMLGLWFNTDPPGYAKLTTKTVTLRSPDPFSSGSWYPPMNVYAFRHETFDDIVFNFQPIVIGFQALTQNENGNPVNVSGANLELKCLTNGDFSNVESNHDIIIDNSRKTISWVTADEPIYIKYLPIGGYEITGSENTGRFTISDAGTVANPVDILWDGQNEIVKVYSRNVPQYPAEREYITIYDYHTRQDQFHTHGLAVLSPTKCTVTEEYNGKYELNIEHPFDEYEKWQYIRENNIIKALGQLFTLKIVEHNFNGNKKTVSGRAEHIFYQQNDWWIFPDSPQLYIIPGNSITRLIDTADIFTSKHIAEGQTFYNFDWSSDLRIPEDYPVRKFSKSDGTSFMEFIMGSGGLLEVSGGELYRDNFHFSINKKMENSSDNAFEIRIGKNLTGIKRNIDITTVCTYFQGYDDFGNIIVVSWDEESVLMVNMPHSVTRSKRFSYTFDEFDEELSEAEKAEISFRYLEKDVLAFFEENCKPLISYEVSLEDVEYNDDFKEFRNKPEYKVGNTGIIYDERLGGAIRLKITQTTKDAITGKTISVLFGTNRSFTNNSYHSVIDIPVESEKEAILFDAGDEIVVDANNETVTTRG